MYGAAEAQVSAEAYGDIVQMTYFPLDGQKVGKSLGWMGVTAVTCIDNRHPGYFCRSERSSFDVVSDGNDVCEAAHYPHCILHSFTLADGRISWVRKAQDVAPEFHHSRGETEPCPCAGFIEKGSELLALHSGSIILGMRNDFLGKCNDIIGLFKGEIGRVNQMFHRLSLNLRTVSFCSLVIYFSSTAASTSASRSDNE